MAVVVFPSVTTSTQFASLGYESPGNPISVSSLAGTGFSVSYDASANNYVVKLPSSSADVLQADTTGARYWNGSLVDAAGGSQATVNVFRPGPQNYDFPNLTYTSFAEYTEPTGQFGDVAFGQATPAGSVPVTGSATYSAFAAGYAPGTVIRGSATLQFNFGAGTLTGSFDPYIYDALAGNTPLGHYDFVNTVFGVGSTSFSGELSEAGVAEHGTFNGLFTGPTAQELMARWTAPLLDPATHTTTTMFGVWVGKH
jgi:hypothetical protein